MSKQKTSYPGKFLLKLSLFMLIVLCLAASPLFGAITVAHAGGGLSLSTSYPGITVKAGENVDFSVKVKNDSDLQKNVALTVKSAPEGWEAYFEGNGNQVQRVYVDRKDSSYVTFNVKIPAEAKEDTYKITLLADGGGGASDTLNLELKVSEQELTKGNFTSQYPELKGAATATFKFSINLLNNSSKDQSYSLSAQPEEGWDVSFSPSYEDKQIASLSVAAGKNQGLDVSIKPPANVKAGKYVIPCSAVSASERLSIELTVNITGTYKLVLTTPSGLLSTDAYAGSESPVTLTVSNKGSADLKDISLSSSAPSNWSVRFSSALLDLPAGASKEVTAYIKPAANAIAGDYALSITAGEKAASSTADFRVAVKTPTSWGIVGVVIILLLIGLLIWLFRKFGRR